MQLSLIAAMGKKKAIGLKGQIPWHLPADLQHVKKTTLGKPLIMGRRTFDSLGKPLPGRPHLVISRDRSLRIDGVDVYHSLNDALIAAAEIMKTVEIDEAIIFGGAHIYKEALPLVTRMYLTFIDHEFDADTFFPDWDDAEWQVISREKHAADDKNKYSYEFVTLDRVFNRK